MSRYWSPAMTERSVAARAPIGSIIALNRKPWRVVEHAEILPGDWDEESRETWLRMNTPDPWPHAPYKLVLTPMPEGPQYLALIRPWQYVRWNILPEHYAVCVSCGELAPCREHQRTQFAAEQMKKTEHEMRLLPGCCPACQEPITSRQQTIDFPGEYIFNPLAPSDPIFHTRSKCSGAAARYEKAWVAADPSRGRSLLTMSCEGHVIVHGDGSAECHGTEECPNIHARHRAYSACYLQSVGCPRECSRYGHAGTRVANPPKGLRP